MLTLLENSRIRSATSGSCGNMCSPANWERRDSASSEPRARSSENAMAVTGTNDSAV